MKKEIMNLLKTENGTLRINEMFLLRRWTLNRETDLLGRNQEFLQLEMKTEFPEGGRAHQYIFSRDFEGIKKEIEASMSQMLADYQEELLRHFRAGRFR